LTHTTFDAITDGLAETTLSDEAGNSLGTAMDLVVRLERVNGAIQGAGGDLQFRAYVELTPDARRVLDERVQFARERDNTRYHKGYPISYRLQGGAPSLQFSIASHPRAGVAVSSPPDLGVSSERAHGGACSKVRAPAEITDAYRRTRGARDSERRKRYMK
jgi:hypothetical protein